MDMGYEVSVNYPKDEQMNSDARTFTVTSKTEILGELDTGDVISLYNNLERAGYVVTPTFTTTDESNEDASPFDIANELAELGIDYKATLKCKNKGTYDEAQILVRLINAHGFDAEVDVKLKIHDESSVDFDKNNTWMDSTYTSYKVTPKAASTDANDLMGLYDTLQEKGYDVSIDIKPKKSTDESSDFPTQLSAYPESTNIKFTLKDSDM